MIGGCQGLSSYDLLEDVTDRRTCGCARTQCSVGHYVQCEGLMSLRTRTHEKKEATYARVLKTIESQN
jgi:hypothetical protein